MKVLFALAVLNVAASFAEDESLDVGAGNLTLADFNQTVLAYVLPSLSRGDVPQDTTENAARAILTLYSDDMKKGLKYDDPSSINGTQFNPHLETKVIVHGYFSNVHTGDWVTGMSDAFLEKGQYNIIQVNWWRAARGPVYSRAVGNVPDIGWQLAELIKMLRDHGGMSLGKLHLIGHSLGAHVCGHAGDLLDGSIARITGLDPAGIMFDGEPESKRLDPSDAVFVDAIHTDTFTSRQQPALGTQKQTGHVDFWPNGGSLQPGCPKTLMDIVRKLPGGLLSRVLHPREDFRQLIQDIQTFLGMGDTHYTNYIVLVGTRILLVCSHVRSAYLFLESIKSSRCFGSVPCDSYDDYKDGKCNDCGSDGCNHLGLKATKRTTGHSNQYLKTSGKEPFCG